MPLNEQLTQLETHLSLHIPNVVPTLFCETLIHYYEEKAFDKSDTDSAEFILTECMPWLSEEPLNSLLKVYFNNGYQIIGSVFDALTPEDKDYLSTTWHLDYGVNRSLKLFIYLNSVEEHQGNTLIIDQYRSELLRDAGALPLDLDKRKEDLSSEMQSLGVSNEALGYDLKAGDALLFSPFLLAHRCLLPAPGQKRYTVCFTLIPS
ncbi:hypothetical protein [Marinomonas algicola]|uniref:hypothetical protein n=1 Tax=Marinomonas algicola TaxID=2773454 RepID=UPI00174B78D9|nr:hypothetical protein [Marinomonas algicola]